MNADTYSPDLVRQFIPKGIDIGNISHQFVAKIEERLNNRPRKLLNYLTPIEVLNKSSGVALQN